jgi:CheY-like chemotaxis protein
VAPAIINAIFHATGKRIRVLPVTPDKLLWRPPHACPISPDATRQQNPESAACGLALAVRDARRADGLGRVPIVFHDKAVPALARTAPAAAKIVTQGPNEPLATLSDDDKRTQAMRTVGETAMDGTTGPAGKRPKVLIVDDDADVAESLGMLLQLHGYEVQVVVAPELAFDMLELHGADVVLLDIAMPGTTGYEVASQIRAAPAFRDTRLFAISGSGQELDRKLALGAGFEDLLVKPVEPQRILDLLRSI